MFAESHPAGGYQVVQLYNNQRFYAIYHTKHQLKRPDLAYCQ